MLKKFCRTTPPQFSERDFRALCAIRSGVIPSVYRSARASLRAAVGSRLDDITQFEEWVKTQELQADTAQMTALFRELEQDRAFLRELLEKINCLDEQECRSIESVLAEIYDPANHDMDLEPRMIAAWKKAAA